MKRNITLIFGLVLILNLSIGQDKITSIDGKTIDCEIISIDSTSISFKIYKNNARLSSYVNLSDVASFVWNGKKTSLHNLDSSLVTVDKQHHQYKDIDIKYPKTLVKLHLLMPTGILVEHNIKNNTTIIFDFVPGFSYLFGELTGLYALKMYILPYMRIEPRIYTTIKKRNLLGKRTKNYSSQFFGFQVKIGIPTPGLESWQTFGPLWGFQRTLGEKGYWNIGLGLGANIYDNEIDYSGIGVFEIGFNLT